MLLLDEPLSNLDAALRAEVAREIRLLQRAVGLTTIMVTHDQDEAMAMADRLVVMKDGTVQQVGTQEDLYERPATPFVAGFIGRSTIMSGTLRDGNVLPPAGPCCRLAGHYSARRPLHAGAAARAAAPRPRTGGRERARSSWRAISARSASTWSASAPTCTCWCATAPAGPAACARPAPPWRLDWDLAAERLFDAEGAPVLPQNAPTPIAERITSHA